MSELWKKRRQYDGRISVAVIFAVGKDKNVNRRRKLFAIMLLSCRIYSDQNGVCLFSLFHFMFVLLCFCEGFRIVLHVLREKSALNDPFSASRNKSKERKHMPGLKRSIDHQVSAAIFFFTPESIFCSAYLSCFVYVF